MANGKDTVYIDVDDEITTVIDKVRSSHEKIVALVLPKRATTFQSSVNMKLLKRIADEDHKRVVLITSESGLLPLAAAAELHVADSLQSKPEVPSSGGVAGDADEAIPVSGSDDFDPAAAGDKSVGELAGAAGIKAVPPVSDDIETLQIEDKPVGSTDSNKSTADSETKKPAKKKLHVPNFERFRLRLVLGVLLIILLVVGLYLALHVLPKASISITTDTSTISSSFGLNLDTDITAVDTTNNNVPAQVVQVQKTYSQQVPATGQQNNGNTASGSIVMTAGSCSGTIPLPVSSGTGVSAGGNTYITQGDASFSASLSNGHCTWQSDSVAITAQGPGAKYNTSGSSSTFAVAGRSDVSATGSATGGTDNIQTIVSQNDINTAEQKLTGQSTTSVQSGLALQLQQDGLLPIPGTFSGTTPSYTSDNQVGDVATNVTVTETVTYTMYGAKQSYLDTLIDNQVKQQINPSKQSILSDGLSSATFKVTNSTATASTGTLTTNVVAGPNLVVSNIKKQVSGMRSGDVKSLLLSYQGVTNVSVHLSPFWVTSVPKSPSKITINLSKSST